MTRSRCAAVIRVALLLILAFTALAACTKISTSSLRSGGNPGTIPGVVRVAIRSEPNSLNPVLSGLYAENYVEEAIFSGLVKLDGSGKLVPDLAQAVPSRANGGVSADGRTLTYHLRGAVRWHDGAPLTAADVVFTFRTIMNPKVNSPTQSVYRVVESVRAVDPLTVVVRLKAPFAPAVGQLFCNGESGEIIPKHLLEHSTDVNRDPFNLRPVGTGPLRFVRWDRGALIVLKPNPDYFGGPPHLRRVDVLIVPDANSLLTMVRSREVDLAAVQPSQLVSLRSIGGLRIEVVPMYQLYFITFNTTHPPFDRVQVRRALALALDRRRIVQTAYSGTAISGDSVIPRYSWAYARDNDSPPSDPEAAKRLLDAAGWLPSADGIRRQGDRRLSFGLITFAGRSTDASMAQQIQAQWRAVGIDAIIHPVPVNVLVGTTGPLTTGNFDVALDDLSFDIDPDRAQLLSSRYYPPHGFNDGHYSNPQMDAWLEAAVRTYDRHAREAFYARVQRLANRDLPYVPLAWPRQVYAVNANLRGLAPETVNSDFWNVQDWSI